MIFREGDTFRWTTRQGDHYEGIISEVDNGTLLVSCDGELRAVCVDDLMNGGEFESVPASKHRKVRQ